MKIPEDKAGLTALLADGGRMAEAIRGGQLPEIIKAYTKVTIGADAKAWVEDVLAEHGVVNRPVLGLPGDGQRQVAHYGKGAPGCVLDGSFESFGEFARAITPAALRAHGLPEPFKDLSSTEPSAGGFLIPETMRAGILTASLESAIVRPRATVIPMSSLSLLVPGVDETARDETLFGGVQGQWVEEGGEITATDPAFQRTKLLASKLCLRTDVPSELVADAAMDVVLESLFGRAIAWFEDIAFLGGSGVGQPLGVLNSPAIIVADKQDDQPADTILWENILAIWSRVLSASQARGVWLASVGTFSELATMAISVGVGGSAIWLQSGSATAPPSLLGRPLIFSEKLPCLGDQGDIGFYDLSEYLIGDRQEMRLEASEHARFTSDMVVYRAIERVDGRAWMGGPITPRGGGPTLSPFVCLEART